MCIRDRCFLSWLAALGTCLCAPVLASLVRARGLAFRLGVCFLGFPAVVCAATSFPTLSPLCNSHGCGVQAMQSARADMSDADLKHHETFASFHEGWQQAAWHESNNVVPVFPMAEAAPCCGLQCETCGENPAGKFWCKDPISKYVRFPPSRIWSCLPHTHTCLPIFDFSTYAFFCSWHFFTIFCDRHPCQPA